MSRRCLSCRQTRSRCDLARPACSRCVQRSIPCVYPPTEGFRFRDQNEVAAENVRRARNPRPQPSTFQLAIRGATPPLPQGATDIFNPEIMPWLNKEAASLAPAVLFTLEEKACRLFFSRWILHPCNHGVCPGYFQFLPDMMAPQPPDSLLRLAVQAAAFAELADNDQRMAFATKAQRNYGMALARIREAMKDPGNACDDVTVAAILVIDTFELIYMDRYEPLGNHAGGLIELLRMRGNAQLYTETGASLWRLVHHRLQARQLLRREQPIPESTEWLVMVNKDRPDFHVASDVHQVNSAVARAQSFLESPNQNSDELANHIHALENLEHETDAWVNTIGKLWLPQISAIDFNSLPQDFRQVIVSDVIYNYHDVWTARTWNYRRACLISLHNMLILLQQCRLTSESGSAVEVVNDVAAESARHLSIIETLASETMSTIPSLLNIVGHGEVVPNPDPETKEVGIIFIMFPMWVIQRCEHTSAEHKAQATVLLEFVHNKMRRF